MIHSWARHPLTSYFLYLYHMVWSLRRPFRRPVAGLSPVILIEMSERFFHPSVTRGTVFTSCTSSEHSDAKMTFCWQTNQEKVNFVWDQSQHHTLLDLEFCSEHAKLTDWLYCFDMAKCPVGSGGIGDAHLGDRKCATFHITGVTLSGGAYS